MSDEPWDNSEITGVDEGKMKYHKFKARVKYCKSQECHK